MDGKSLLTEYASAPLTEESHNVDIPAYYQQSQEEPHQHQPKKGARVFSSEERETVICRNCHGGLEEGEDLIAPCSCSGSVKYVHRHCLDTWRTVSQNPDSFYRCDICHGNYQFEKLKNDRQVTCSYIKYGLLVALDISIVLLIWQALVVLCAVIFHFADAKQVRLKKFPPGTSIYAIDYLCGLLSFFFILGVLGVLTGITLLIAKCCKLLPSSQRSYTYNSYPYTSYGMYDPFMFYFFWWSFSYPTPGNNCFCLPLMVCTDINGCNCGDCDCGSCANINIGNIDLGNDSNGLGALAVIAIIIVVIMVIIGVFVGLALMGIIVFSIMKRRISIIKKRDDVCTWKVMDLDV